MVPSLENLESTYMNRIKISNDSAFIQQLYAWCSESKSDLQSVYIKLHVFKGPPLILI